MARIRVALVSSSPVEINFSISILGQAGIRICVRARVHLQVLVSQLFYSQLANAWLRRMKEEIMTGKGSAAA
ncbi:MAG TPA: hypothetical protein VF172_11960 [Nitrososphaera sp.]|jgi:hypothetical protein